MRFDVIVHAPVLRIGARLNIAAADQPAEGVSLPMAIGAEVKLRLGVCCPDHANGRITSFAGPDSDSAILSVDAQSWTIQRTGSGVTDPGLFSETWFVVASAGEA